jgi:hypothetical protein
MNFQFTVLACAAVGVLPPPIPPKADDLAAAVHSTQHSTPGDKAKTTITTCPHTPHNLNSGCDITQLLRLQ